jgi:hypothetical protein
MRNVSWPVGALNVIVLDGLLRTSMIGVALVHGAGALTTVIETLSAVGARYCGRRSHEFAADEDAQVISNVTVPRLLEVDPAPPPGVPPEFAAGLPPPPEQDASATRLIARRTLSALRRAAHKDNRRIPVFLS